MNDTTSPTSFQKTSIRPFDCLCDSKSLLEGRYWLFMGIVTVGMLIGSCVPFGILMGPMMCGIFYCYFKKMRNEPLTFDMLFKGFDYFTESLIATLIFMGFSLVIFAPFFILLIVALVAAPDPETILPILIIIFYPICLIACIGMSVFFMFTYPLIVDRNLKAWPAICTSARAAKAHLGGVLGLMLLIYFITMVASLCCYFPAFFVLPFSMGTWIIAYRKVFPALDTPQTTTPN